MVKLKEELQSKQKLKAKVETALEKLRTEGLDRLNTTDPESARIHGRQGSHAGYNAQIVVDDRHGLIVQSDVVNENNDLGQFANQVEQAQETLDKPCEVACADAGYSNADELEKVELPFGHIKRNLGVDSFLLRGLAGVRAEMSILCSCFNIARLIGLFGVPGLIFRLTQLGL